MNRYNVYNAGKFVGQFYAKNSQEAIFFAKLKTGCFSGSWTAELV